ncbi:MAG: hypothetical protein P1P85_03900 [Patescibacteria group bacterium]|nr:hypothetical protein [Patescibacteria group bacterium]
MTLKKVIIGNERIGDMLEKSYKSGKLSHAYLFEGSDHIGKKTLAIEFSSLLLNDKSSNIENNVDFIILFPDEDKKQIIIEQIRNLEKKLSLYPFSSKYKVVIIEQAEKMTKSAANALLKTLEEPSKTTILMLLTSNSKNILDTIKSRCQIMKFLPVKRATLEDFVKSKTSNQIVPDEIIELSGYKPGKIVELINDKNKREDFLKTIDKISNIARKSDIEKIDEAEIISQKDPEEIINILNLWTIYFRRTLINVYEENNEKQKRDLIVAKRRVDLINKTREDILTKNINVKLAIENLVLKI